MSEPKFTPGPWSVWPGNDDNEKVTDDKLGRHLAYIVRGAPEHIANARLIAAAPDLYSALYDIRNSNAGSIERKRGWNNALTALAKARGEA
jgi:hypothetical protein